MGNPIGIVPPPGMQDVNVAAGSGSNENPSMTAWRSAQQERYNQVTGLANMLSHISSNPQQYGQDNANIAGGYYLQFLGEKNPFQVLPKYVEKIQSIVQAHQQGAEARAKAGTPAPQMVQPGPQPPPGSSISPPQAAVGQPPSPAASPSPGGGPAALPASPTGQIGPPPGANIQPPAASGPMAPTGFAASIPSEMDYTRQLLTAQAQAPLQARMNTFDPEVKMLVDKGIPQDKAAMLVMSTRGYLPGGMFTAEAQAAKSGYIMDPMTGQMRPMTTDEISSQGKAQIELQGARAASQQAMSDLEKAKAAYLTDPNNPKLQNEMQVKLLMARYAGERLQLAQQGMGIRQNEYGANFDPSQLTTTQQQNMALPTDASGQAVPLKSPLNPGGTQKGKQFQASSIQDAGQNLIARINANRDKFGNVPAIMRAAFLGTPMSDPESQGLASQIKSFSALQPSLHGFRGQKALDEFTGLMGGLPNNPDSLIQGINGMLSTAASIRTAVTGTPTTRDKKIPPPPPGSSQSGGGLIYARDPSGKLHKAPVGTKLLPGWKAENAPAGQ